MIAMMATAIFPASSLSSFPHGIMSMHMISDRMGLPACLHQVVWEQFITIHTTELKIPLPELNADLADEINHPSWLVFEF